MPKGGYFSRSLFVPQSGLAGSVENRTRLSGGNEDDMRTKTERKAEGRRRQRRFLLLLILGILLTACSPQQAGTGVPQENAGSGGGLPQSSQEENSGAERADLGQTQDGSQNEEGEHQVSELTVHFIDVGQGDCTLITCGEEAMLIDAGDNDQGTKIQNYLQKRNIETLKYVIGTHPDADHIGGMDVILYKFACETIFMTEEERDTKSYEEVTDTLKEKGYHKTFPIVGESFSLGDAEFTIIGPVELGEESNDNSISILLKHGENRFLFTGDAMDEEELDLVRGEIPLAADVYKAGHHGSSTSSCQELLEAVSPAYAVISCGEGNSYGHPHAEPLNEFRARGIQVFRTDEQGSITVTSDGESLKWNCSPSESWQTGETPVKVPEDPPTEITYICNTNTKKFHYPDCSSVGEMSEKNKLPVTWTREEVIGQGYAACKRCRP